MVRTSRRQALPRTTLPPVEQAVPSEEAALEVPSQPADEADHQAAETDVDQETEQRFDADRLLPGLSQEMNLPQEAKDHLYQEIQRACAATAARECPGQSERTAATQSNAASTTTATPPPTRPATIRRRC